MVEEERKLASIQVITSLAPIKDADFIEKARVKGWDVVVKKDEFTPGSQCVFFELDSILPSEKDWSEFMRTRKFRVKTCKLRGVLSQGLALPLDILPEGIGIDLEVGLDVTEALGVIKFEEPPSSCAEDAGARPSWIPKTDEIRVQSAPEKIDELKGRPYYLSVKYDGQSGSFGCLHGEFVVASRSRKKKPTEEVKADVAALAEKLRAEGVPEEEIPKPERVGPSNWRFIARKYNLEEKMPEGFVLQGEVYGPSLQKNRLAVKELEFAAFDVFSVKEDRYLGLDELLAFCEKIGVPTVKIEERGDSFNYTMEELLAKADGMYEGTQNRREGLVIRSQGAVDQYKGRISFKAISNKFLLKCED